MIRAIVGVAVLSSFLMTMAVAPSTLAQEQAATIQATGTGMASAPAVSAQLQFLVGATSAYGMGSFSMGGTALENETGTPVAAMPSSLPMDPTALSETQLTPLLDALGSAGIQSDAIAVTIPVYSSIFGPGGPETAELRVTIDQPQRDNLVELVKTVTDTATANGITVLYVGARYQAADCATLTQQAREAAIADAQVHAEGLAQGLGVTLGTLQQASEFGYFDGSGTDSCNQTGALFSIGDYGPGSEPAFDPDATEVSIVVQVTLSYTFTTA